MKSVPIRIASAFTLVFALSAGLPVARAAVPEPPGPGLARTAPDTSHFLPPWLHLHASGGFGWIASPTQIRQRYEPGQDFEFGLETRMRRTFRLRLNGEYQILPALGIAKYTFATFTDAEGNQARDRGADAAQASQAVARPGAVRLNLDSSAGATWAYG